MSRQLGVHAISETQFQGQVLDLAAIGGWELRYHTFSSIRSAKGFPDLVLLREPELIIAELKTEYGRLTAEQMRWITALTETAAAIAEHVEAAAAAPPRPGAAARDIREHVGLPLTGRATIPPAFEVYVWRPSDLPAIQARLLHRPERSAA